MADGGGGGASPGAGGEPADGTNARGAAAMASLATADRHMVLIHGAWQGSWVWQAWLPELARLGWTGHAVDLPGNGCDPADRTGPRDVSLALYTAHVAALVRQLTGPVVVVGHSGGGIVASQLAEALHERLRGVVHVAGMMLPNGMTFRQLVGDVQRDQPDTDFSGIAPHLRWSPDGLTSEVPVEAARRIFLHDADDASAASAAARLRPQPERGRAVVPGLSAARHGRVPRLYVEALRDRSLRLPLQRRMQQLSPGARRLAIDCGHVPQLVRPRELAERVCAALAGLPSTAASASPQIFP